MKIFSFIILALSLSACVGSGTHFEVATQAEKHKLEVIDNARPDNSATIYSPKKVYFTHVDEKKLLGMKYIGLGLSGFPTALTVSPGTHDFELWKNGSPHFDLHIKSLNLEGGENYFINYIAKKIGSDTKLYYWVENINTGEVIQGRKRTLEELNNL